MKILHLSDLHIGKSLYQYGLIEDQKYILNQILEMCRQEKPDVILLVGDIYDRTLPSGEAVALFDFFLTEIARLELPLLSISGNHDSGDRIAYASHILAQQGLYFSGGWNKFETLELEQVILKDQWGDVAFTLLPFFRPADIRRFFKEEEAPKTYEAAIQAILKRTPPKKNCRNVLLTHQFYTAAGIQPERADNETVSVGGLDNIDIGCLKDYDYVALGHIHKPQQVGLERIRYCGTPLKYSVSEATDVKNALFVILDQHGDLTFDPKPLKPLRDLRIIEGPLVELIRSEVLQAANCEDYVHVRLTDSEEIPNAMQILREAYPHILDLRYINQENNETILLTDLDDFERQTTLDELFETFYIHRTGQPLDQKKKALIADFLEEGSIV